MSKTKHTPGPWKYTIHPIKKDDGGIAPGHGSIHAPTDTRIFGRDPRRTVVYLPGFYEYSEQPEIEANAKIIAAAPDMLRALEQIVAYEDRGRARGEPRISETWYNECVEAINKAKGIEPS